MLVGDRRSKKPVGRAGISTFLSFVRVAGRIGVTLRQSLAASANLLVYGCGTSWLVICGLDGDIRDCDPERITRILRKQDRTSCLILSYNKV